MSRSLTLWSKFLPGQPGQKANVGASWLISPNGHTPEADKTSVDPTTGGILKTYLSVHPDSLVIHWLFPNFYVGHVLWISQAPAHLTMAQIDAVRRIERQLAEDWENSIRWDFITTPPHFDIHWDLRQYTKSNLPTTNRGRNQERVLSQLSPETIDHYADLLENREYEFSDLNIDLVVDRQDGVAYYTGNNGLRTYPLDRLGYHNICRALCRVRAYRRKHEKNRKE